MSRGAKSLSMPLALGVGLLCFALSFALSSVVPAWEARGKLADQFAQLSQQRDSQAQAIRVTEETPKPAEEKIEPEKLPPGGKLQKLQQLITAQGLHPDSISYRKEQNPESGAMQYHIAVPFKTTYPNLRNLLEKLQGELPALQLDRMSLQRTRASEQMLDVQLELVLPHAEAGR